MTTIQSLLLIAIAGSGSIGIIGMITKRRIMETVFKPLTTILIILFVLLSGKLTQIPELFVLLGLLLCLVGDILLMWGKKWFLAGSASFGAALILFAVYSMQAPGPYFQWGIIIGLMVVALVFLLIFLKRAGNQKTLLVLYTFIMMFFISQAAGRAWYIAESGTEWMLAGAVFFALSDTFIAIEKFKRPFKLAPLIYMPLYWAALLLITFSATGL